MLDHELVDTKHFTIVDYQCIECTYIIFIFHAIHLRLLTARIRIQVFDENSSNNSLPFIRHGEDILPDGLLNSG
jgi:hypothetical protein